ncbi:acyltransferase [Frankia sp. R43]|uniref:MBOAT family O-acyltransferase n=1 Tax=Frankia sp. R43 TaxID=269536 RepID=UPI0006C9F966|nr:MBOAT family O-acyltransferase [Frankia sp. R43]KPM57481.1 acyltransferase [Frankia sp. R43]
MVFPTIEFAAFLVIVMAVSWLLMPVPALWKPFILAASYFFYSYADARFVLLIVSSTLINQLAAVAIGRWRDRRILIAAIVCDLGLLGWFKYYGFFALSVDRALQDVGLPAPLPLLQVALPIGISFFTFQALSYVIDVWRGDIRPVSLIDFAVYEAFFPHLVAGPIVRASEFTPQLATPRDPSQVQVTRAIFLIGGGLVKKVVLADLLATRIVDPVFDAPGQHSSGEIAVAVYGYAVQIYCDFSAYSDIAIGVALLLGFRFPDNFDRPYAAVSLQDFWRRWHMTLSRWLRDYVYLPLGGNRRGRRRTYLNLMITMVLGGLWHGAAWTFVIWGALHGGVLAGERAWRAHRGGPGGRPGRGPTGTTGPRHRAGGTGGAGGTVVLPRPKHPELADPGFAPSHNPGFAPSHPLPAPTPSREELPGTGMAPTGPREPGLAAGAAVLATAAPPIAATTPMRGPTNLPRVWLGRILVFHFVCAAWVLFRSPDLGTAAEIFGRLFTAGGPSPLVTTTVLVAIAAGLGAAAVPGWWWVRAQGLFAARRLGTQIILVVTFLLVIYAFVGQQDVAPFIYFRF